MMNADINSCSFIIRDGILERLKQVPTFQSVARWGTTKMTRVQPKDIPFFGCYLIEEMMAPDGDPNHAQPRFVHTVRLGFSVFIQSNDDAIAERNLDSAHWTIMRLLEQMKWHRFPASGTFLDNPYTQEHNDVRIESIIRGARKHSFGNRAIDNETPVAELQMDLTIVHRTEFPPIVKDDLRKIHVTVAYPWPYDPNLEEPFTVEYDLLAQGDLEAPPYATLAPKFATPKLTSP